MWSDLLFVTLLLMKQDEVTSLDFYGTSKSKMSVFFPHGILIICTNIQLMLIPVLLLKS